MFDTFRNAWKIADLRKRLIFTFVILVLFRLGCAVPVPFINKVALDAMFTTGNMLTYLNMMSGGALSQCTLFALGIMPYINASIILQLLTVAIPALEQMAKEGPEGQKKIQRITRYAGGGLGLVLAFGYYFILRNMGALKYVGGPTGIFAAAVIIACFTAGSMLVVWLGEQIDAEGIGNGISLIIFAGIVARWSNLYNTFTSIVIKAQSQPLYYVLIPVILILAVAAVVFVVIFTNAERRIPVQYAKRVVGRKMYGGQATYVPIKVNMSGVMPIIFASSLCSLPGTIGSFINLDPNEHPLLYGFFHGFNYTSLAYVIIYLVLIIAFNYFYVAIQYNPVEIANNLRKNSGAIPGIRPGKPTSEFIARVINKITLIGALFLAAVAVLPIVLGNVTGISIQLGGTSLLIVVGVALDAGRSMESFMLMRHHKGFLE